jgi:hypothetical protein
MSSAWDSIVILLEGACSEVIKSGNVADVERTFRPFHAAIVVPSFPLHVSLFAVGMCKLPEEAKESDKDGMLLLHLATSTPISTDDQKDIVVKVRSFLHWYPGTRRRRG